MISKVLLILFFMISLGYAQDIIEGSAQYYVYPGGEGELQIKVQIWGQVARPGMYQVPKSMDVVGLISLAGGPNEDSDLSNVKIIRTIPVSDVLKINLVTYTRNASAEYLTILEAGDTVIIPENTYHKFSKLIRIVAQLAIVANVYYLFFERE